MLLTSKEKMALRQFITKQAIDFMSQWEQEDREADVYESFLESQSALCRYFGVGEEDIMEIMTAVFHDAM